MISCRNVQTNLCLEALITEFLWRGTVRNIREDHQTLKVCAFFTYNVQRSSQQSELGDMVLSCLSFDLDKVTDSNLHKGYFCYTVFIRTVSVVVNLYQQKMKDLMCQEQFRMLQSLMDAVQVKANYNKPMNTKPDAENPERNKEQKTIADVTYIKQSYFLLQ